MIMAAMLRRILGQKRGARLLWFYVAVAGIAAASFSRTSSSFTLPQSWGVMLGRFAVLPGRGGGGRGARR